MTKHKSAGEYVKAVGQGSSTMEVATKLKVSEDVARYNLSVLRGLQILVETSKDHWRKA